MSKNYQVELQIKGASASDQEQSAGRFKNLNDENSSHFRSTIHRSNPLSRLTFAFIAPIIYRSWKRDERGQELTENDLLTFPHHLRGDSLEKKFMQRIRNQEKKSLKKTVSTALAVLGTSKWMFFKAVFLQTAFCFIRIFICWVMKRLIDSYLDPEKYNTDAFWWAGIMVGLLAIELFVCHHWSYSTLVFTGHMRVGIINMIYNKITRLSGYTITKLSPGQLVNLAANDVNTIEQLGFFFPSVIAGLLTMIAGAALLWIYFGVTCLIGIVYLLVNIPLQGLIANASKKPRNEKNDVTDERVRRTGEMIQDIRLLKMYTWEMKFKDIITSIRKKDCSLNNQVIFWDSLSRALAWSSVYVSSFLVFMLYDVTGGNLQVSEVFSGYFIFAFLKVFAGYFIAISVGFMAEAKLFFDRLNGIMEAPEMGEVKFEKPHDTKNSVEFENFNGYWEKEESTPAQSTTTEQNLKTQAPKDIKATLADINIHLKRRSLNAVVGPVGSGKTSFLLTFTGEMPFSTGQLRYQGSVAYVEQEPTIFAGTFRESILFGKPYNEEFYNQVIKACNLENDLKLFPKGDMSMIGERGNNLSGGQKARLSLARAVYADTDIYLLDDPLSAVDAKVAKSIYEETILGLLKEKTVILVTHQVHFVRDAGNIIVMEGGRILSNGTFDQLKEKGVDVNRIFSVEEKKKKNDEDEEEEENQGSPVEKQTTATVGGDNEEEKLIKKKEEKVVKSTQPADNGEDTSHFAAEDPHAGQVNVKTYVLLFKEIGWAFMFLIFVLSVFTQFGDVAFGRILGAWTSTQFNLGESLGSLGGIALYMFTIHLVKNLAVSYGLFAAAKGYHQKMLDKIVRSTVSFFDLNPVGRILNRFSNDIGVLDKFFPSVCLDVFDTFFTAGAVAITLGIIQPLLLAPILGAFIVIGILVRLFFPAIKKTKGFDLGTRGPLFSLLSSSIAGVGIIRTFNNISFFQKKFSDLLYVNSKGAINFVFASTFLGFCVDASYCLAAMGMIFITTAKIEPNPASGAIAAFTLALILSLTGFFQHGVRQLCQTNVLMASVSRVQAYSSLPTEAPIATSHDADCKSQHWPQKGDIEFNKVYMKYRPELDYTIRALDLHANPGEKIGCVGRTGAGKSTIINLLFRLQEIDRSGDNAKDSYIKIDGVNTQPLGLHLLRGNISIIPQTPFIFTGTIKENLDPLGEFSDQQIWDALAEVRLKEHVEALPDKIKTNMNNASSVFSTGQKQLICLARTLLKPCKVLVLDEATANMDTETDMFIQKKIMEKFADSTVFTIAHRLATIANYDKVLVLDKGRKVEFDTPYKLLAKNIGDETLTNTEGHFGSMVVRTGPKASQRILNIAKEAYYQKKNKVNLDI